MKDSQLFMILAHITLLGCLLAQPYPLKFALLVVGLVQFAISRMEHHAGK